MLLFQNVGDLLAGDRTVEFSARTSFSPYRDRNVFESLGHFLGVSKDLFDRRVEYRSFYMDGSNPSRMIRFRQDRWFG